MDSTFDLRFDPETYFDLPFNELKDEILKTPKFLRTIRSNKSPVLLHANYASRTEPYLAMTKEQLLNRAKLIKKIRVSVKRFICSSRNC